ncbi:hypothetical protein AUC61_08590 [Pseudomonas sp. S25]|uniref:DUF4225 domain-containing protein n=2 Tax=Pseudomonas maioricensis TaxID=1766623 RepID=A0ABS9ZGN7_9PSED|nr:hypothetical protein [Pseudomonas sp. S25]
MQHIQDGMLRLQFNREVAYYAQGIVRDVEGGKKSILEGLKAFRDKHTLLTSHQWTVLSQSVGLVAGGFQFAGGVAICTASGGLACAGGAFMIAHGMNNIHENTVNLWEGSSDTVGATRMVYRKLAEERGYGTAEGDIAYGVADIATSLYGTFRKTLKPGAWRLYRYIETDYIRAYKSTPNWILGFDAAAGAFTTKSIHDELKKND